jgi:hypothetical protein
MDRSVGDGEEDMEHRRRERKVFARVAWHVAWHDMSSDAICQVLAASPLANGAIGPLRGEFGSDRGQTGVRPGSERGQTTVAARLNDRG